MEDGTKAPHTWNDGVVTKPATETDEGVMTYTCTVCDREKTEPIPATGHTHNWSQTYLYGPDGHWQTCSGCNETTAPQQHTYGDWIVDKEATQTEQGSRHRECTVCGYEQSETIPMTGSRVTVTYASAASESAAFEWADTSAAKAKVEYKLSSENSYTAIDDELIRQISQTTARADILGLKGGEKYDFRITDSDGKTAVYTGIEIAAYDRSGYAHFNYIEGVGAYNDDGTLKSGAVIVYVTEDTKNTVQARLDGKTYTGLVNILQNIYRENNPVVIRVLGQISAATWNQIEYNADKKYNSSNKIPESEVVDINGKPLPGQRMEQDEILKGGYNTLDTSKYSELEGLTNRITYKEGEFDSRYNDCSISDAQNVTFEGVGEDAEIFQWGMTWSNCTSIEVRNLTFDDYTEDACSFQGSANATSASGFDTQRVWFHHNTVNQGMNYWDVSAEQDKHEGDGGTDLTRVSYATLSYNHYYNCHKTGLVGGSNANTAANITFHHNWYEDCNSRLPLARQANMHMYNNYYDGSTGTNMSLRAGAFAFIENCYFDNANHPIQTTAAENRDAFAKVYNCIFVGDNIESEYNVTVVNNRSQAVGNTDNFLGEDYYYFDTNSSVFYYDDTNERSDVEEMLETGEIPTVIPQVAGSLKRNSNITETPEQGGGTVTPPEQGEGEESGSGFTATVSVDGSTIVESNSADLTFESGITTGETNKYSVSNDRIYLGGNAAYIKLTFNAAAGQSIELVVNAAAGSSSGIKIVGTNATVSGNSSYALSDTATDCVFNLTADSDGSVTITITRSEPSSTYVYSVSVTVD